MDMKKVLGKTVQKLKVKDLEKVLKKCDSESEVILSFYGKEKGYCKGYLAEVTPNFGWDSVLEEKLEKSTVLELTCFVDEYSNYVKQSEG